MPELPEVETVRRGLEGALVGRRIVDARIRRRDLRLPVPERFAERIIGARIEAARRRAKYLLFDLDGAHGVLAHLGMSGRMLARRADASVDAEKRYEKHDHIIFLFDNGTELVFRDPRRFGVMTLFATGREAEHPLLVGLGPEPLSAAFSVEYLADALAKRSGPIKTALMDQRLVVGVGNIYACEALLACGLHPATPARACAARSPEIIQAIQHVLEEAITAGGSSFRDHVMTNGEAGFFQHRWKVYGREGKPCAQCAAPIQRLVLAGRSSFFCPQCQTAPGTQAEDRKKTLVIRYVKASEKKEKKARETA